MAPDKPAIDPLGSDLGTREIKSQIDAIPHFFRHMGDLLHLPIYDSEFSEEKLLQKWNETEQQDLDALVRILGFQKGHKTLDKKKPLSIEEKLIATLTELHKSTKDMGMGWDEFKNNLDDLNESTVFLDLFLGSDCFTLDPKDLKILSVLKDRVLAKIQTAVKKFDSCLTRRQISILDTQEPQNGDHRPHLDVLLEALERAVLAGLWIPYSAVSFMDLIPRFKSIKKVIVLSENGSDGASAALFLHLHKKRLFTGLCEQFNGKNQTPSKTSKKNAEDVSLHFVLGGFAQILVE